MTRRPARTTSVTPATTEIVICEQSMTALRIGAAIDAVVSRMSRLLPVRSRLQHIRLRVPVLPRHLPLRVRATYLGRGFHAARPDHDAAVDLRLDVVGQHVVQEMNAAAPGQLEDAVAGRHHLR